MKAILDCNNFYCSCERLFKPHLKTQPVVVLSNNDGCVISRSDEAKLLGIKMAAPYFMIKPIIEENNIAAFSSNYALYGDLSKRVMETIATVLPENCIEVYSVDEAFLNLEHIPLEKLECVVKEIKDKVELWTGIAVSIGVAPTKTLSKIANYLAKSNKTESRCLMILDTDEKITSALQRTPVEEIWGVGKQYAAKLEPLGIRTAFDFSMLPKDWFRSNMGGVVGLRLFAELNGSPSILVEEQLSSKKIVSCSRRFGMPLTDFSQIREAVATYITRAAEKLRRQYSVTGTITVYLIPKEKKNAKIYKPSTPIETCMMLPNPTSATNWLIKYSQKLLQEIYQQGKTYEKAGVIFSNLTPDCSIQGNLFSYKTPKAQNFLMEKVDNINFGMRNEMVKFAAAGIKKPWKMKQEFLSKQHTTRWNELMNVT